MDLVRRTMPEDSGCEAATSDLCAVKPTQLFDARLNLHMAYASEGSDGIRPGALCRDVLDCLELPTASDDPIIEKLRRLGRARMQKELKRQVKRQLREDVDTRPSLHYELFERRLAALQGFSRELSRYDTFSTTVDANAQEGVFLNRVARGPESELPLFAFGPASVTDSGSLKLDLGSFVFWDEVDAPEMRVAEQEKRPWVSGKYYAVSTDVNVSVDPIRAGLQGDLRETLRSYGVAVEVSWLSAVLGRELFSAEVEAKSDLTGDYKAFLNILVKSR